MLRLNIKVDLKMTDECLNKSLLYVIENNENQNVIIPTIKKTFEIVSDVYENL
jgi:hypothetical protein